MVTRDGAGRQSLRRRGASCNALRSAVCRDNYTAGFANPEHLNRANMSSQAL